MAGPASTLQAPTLCDGWDVRSLMNHMLDTQRYFLEAARGEDASPIAPEPPPVLSDDPVAQFEPRRAEMLEVFGQPGVVEKTGPALGIAFSDQLLHGWDLARATIRTRPYRMAWRTPPTTRSTAGSPTTNATASSSPRSQSARTPQPRTSSSPTPGGTRRGMAASSSTCTANRAARRLREQLSAQPPSTRAFTVAALTVVRLAP